MTAVAPDRPTTAVDLLWPGRTSRPSAADPPAYFADLNLDQVERAIVSGRDADRLLPVLRTRLDDRDVVRYRQDVFRDVDRAEVAEALTAFGQRLDRARRLLAEIRRLRTEQLRHRWHLRAIDEYVRAVRELGTALDALPIRSAGLQALRAHVADQLGSAAFGELEHGARDLLHRLDEVRYALLLRGAKVVVGRFDEESDYGADVLATFARFRPERGTDRTVKRPTFGVMNGLEIEILDMVAQLEPEVFGALAEFCRRHPSFIDPTLDEADRDLQFYLGYLGYLAPIRATGCAVAYPGLADTPRLRARRTFDLALAAKLTGERTPVVANDVELRGNERILVVSGPNQGGKTTLARTVGQLYHLAALGCPVPGIEVDLFLPDAIFSHFERAEDLATLAGKLEDELVRMRGVLDAATGASVIIMNEAFNSTTVQDAETLSRRVLTQISALDAVAVLVTFIDELSRLDEKTVSMVSLVDPDDPAVRTFRLERRPADGRAYAMAIATKYRLTAEAVAERIGGHRA